MDKVSSRKQVTILIK